MEEKDLFIKEKGDFIGSWDDGTYPLSQDNFIPKNLLIACQKVMQEKPIYVYKENADKILQ